MLCSISISAAWLRDGLSVIEQGKDCFGPDPAAQPSIAGRQVDIQAAIATGRTGPNEHIHSRILEVVF
jgi:hypothetical protein